MDNLLEHIYKKFECAYYKQHPGIQITEDNCINKEGLDCNCIPGIVFNYMGYIYSTCLDFPGIRTSFTPCSRPSGNIAYMQIRYKDQALLPALSTEMDSENYSIAGSICKRQQTYTAQVYLPFRIYRSLEILSAEIEHLGIMRTITSINYLYSYRIKFWESFLMAMRIQKVETCSRAFLSMAIFMSPSKTLQPVIDAMKNGRISDRSQLQQLAEFFYDYIDFIRYLKQNIEHGFFFHITQGFKELTSIDLKYFIEKIIYNNKVSSSESSLRKLFYTAYDDNLQELTRRKGKFIILQKQFEKNNISGDIVQKIKESIDFFNP